MEEFIPYLPPRLFYFDLACEYGLDVSVFVTNLEQTILHYAMQKDWAKRENPETPTLVVNGLTYAPFSLKDLQREFPWWSQRQIERIKSEAIKAGLIQQGCYNADSRDRRAWYAVSLIR